MSSLLKELVVIDGGNQARPRAHRSVVAQLHHQFLTVKPGEKCENRRVYDIVLRDWKPRSA